jgi:uncharacterized protein involved in exopolysaccharide biosynthesis
MAMTFTPRDRLGRLGDFGKKALRYWWLVPAFLVVGAALSVFFAMRVKPKYQSWSVIFYQERISTSTMLGRQAEQVQRNIGDRYREMLLARNLLVQVIEDPKVNPLPKVVAAEGVDVAVDELRQAIKFEAKGTSAFRVIYTDSTREGAQAVTDRLTKLLQKAEEDMRRTQALATADFAQTQKEQAGTELKVREKALAEFLAKHPEFAQDAGGASTEGAGIRKIKDSGGGAATTSGNPKIYALERQRQRVIARLNAKPDGSGTPAPRKKDPTPEQQAAIQVVAEAERDYQSKQRELESTQAKFTEKHPSVVKAREDVTAALQRLRRAQAAVPADADEPVIVAPATAEDRDALQKELTQLEGQIADAQRASSNNGNNPGSASKISDATNWVVKLETEHTDLRRGVAEQREKVESLADSVFRAQIDANQQLAEQGTRLSIVDPAFKPLKPMGKGRTLIVLAGVFLFGMMGTALALGLALIDDRIYRRADLENLEMVSLLAVIPSQGKTRQAREVKHE